MKTNLIFLKLLIIYILVSNSILLFAQQQIELNSKTFRAWVKYQNSRQRKSGVLWEVQDSAIVLFKSSIVPSAQHGTPKKSYDSISVVQSATSIPGHFKKQINTTIKYDQIDIIQVRRKGRLGMGILIGSISGLLIGTLTAFSITTQDQSLEKIPFMMLGTGIGVGLGAIVGSLKINVPINGCYQLLESQRKQLQGYEKVKRKK